MGPMQASLGTAADSKRGYKSSVELLEEALGLEFF